MFGSIAFTMILTAILLDYFPQMITTLPPWAGPMWSFTSYGFFFFIDQDPWKKVKKYWAGALALLLLLSFVLGEVVLIPSIDPFLLWVDAMGENHLFFESSTHLIQTLWQGQRPTPGATILWIFLLAAAFRLMEKKKGEFWLLIPLVFYAIRWFRYEEISRLIIGLYLFGFFILLLRAHPKRSVLFVTGAVFAFYSIYSWIFPHEWMNDRVGRWLPDLIHLRTVYERSGQTLYHSSLSSESALGGPLTFTGEPLFRVEGDVPGLYLRGRTYTTYARNRWVNEERTYQQANFDKKPASLSYRVINEGIATSTLFVPMSVKEISLDAERIYRNANGSTFYDYRLIERPIASYRVLGGKSQTQTTAPGPLYRQSPSSLALEEVVHTLITPSMGDLERMEALTDHLRKNYDYSLIPTPPDEGEDFLTHFLFKEGKGYCTAYATSLAILGRIAGVPTRYVEGFVVPRVLSGESYLVTDREAHAWVEAYIEGRGWTLFEATPIYGAVESIHTPETMEQVRRDENPSIPLDITTDENIRPGGAARQVAPSQLERQNPIPWILCGLLAIGALIIGWVKKTWTTVDGIYLWQGALKEIYQRPIEEELRLLFERGLYGPKGLDQEEEQEMKRRIKAHLKAERLNKGWLVSVVRRLKIGRWIINGREHKKSTTP